MKAIFFGQDFNLTNICDGGIDMNYSGIFTTFPFWSVKYTVDPLPPKNKIELVI